MNLKERQAQIAKIDLKFSDIGKTLDTIHKDLDNQIKWIEIDENNIKFEFNELMSEMKASDDYFETKRLEKRRQIEEKYMKSPEKKTVRTSVRSKKTLDKIDSPNDFTPLESNRSSRSNLGIVNKSQNSLQGSKVNVQGNKTPSNQ